MIKTKKAVSVFVGLVTGVALTGVAAVMPLVAAAETYNFTATLKLGSKGTEVMNLQKVLNSDPSTQVSVSGVGAPGAESTYFGSKTKAAVVKFQAKNGIAQVGQVGPATRAKLNSLFGSGVPGGVVVPGTDLVVTLASDSPLAGALINGQAVGDLAHFTLTNKGSVDAKVTGLAFNRTGISNDATLSNVYLYEGARRLTDAAAVSQTRISFNDTGLGLLTVPAGSSKTIAVKADIAAGTAGQLVGVSLASVTSNVAVSSMLPVGGHIMSIANATLATVSFATTITPAASDIDPQDGYIMWQNTVSVNTRAVDMKSFALRQIGSVSASDLRNFKLYVDGVQVGMTVASVDANGYVTFDLTASPVRLQTGNRIVKVLGDVVGGSTRTFSFSLRQPGDAMMVDSELGQPVLAQRNNTTFSTVSTGVQTIQAGTLTITKKTDSPSGNVTPNASGVVLGKFEFKAAGEAVKVENLRTYVNSSLNAATPSLRNGALFANGVQVGSTAALMEDNTGAVYTEYNLGSSLIVYPGSPVTVEIKADISTATTSSVFVAGTTLQAGFAVGSQNVQKLSSLAYVNSSAVTANPLTVAVGALSMTENLAYGDRSVVVPQTAYKVAAFNLTGGAAESTLLDTIVVNFGTASSTDVYVKYGTKTTSIKPTIVAGNNSFSINETLAPGASLPVEVYATISSSNFATGNTITATVTVSGTTPSAQTPSTGAIGGQTITLAGGSITSAFVNDLTSKLLVGGGDASQKVAAYKFTAVNDTFTVTDIAIKASGLNAGTAIRGYELKVGGSPIASGTLSGTTATSSNLALVVAPGSPKQVDVFFFLNNVATGGATTTANIVTTLEGFKHTSNSQGTTEDATDRASTNNLYVVKTKPTLSRVSVESGTLTNGTNKSLFSFAVAADNAGALMWKKVVFNVDKTAAVTIGATSTLKLYESGVEVAGVFATTTGSLVGGVDSLGAATSDTISFVATNPQEIGAGGSKTYELRGTVAGASTANYYTSINVPSLSTTIATPDVYATVAGAAGTQTPSFVWTDESTDNPSESTADWLNDFLIGGSPTMSTTLSVN